MKRTFRQLEFWSERGPNKLGCASLSLRKYLLDFGPVYFSLTNLIFLVVHKLRIITRNWNKSRWSSTRFNDFPPQFPDISCYP